MRYLFLEGRVLCFAPRRGAPFGNDDEINSEQKKPGKVVLRPIHQSPKGELPEPDSIDDALNRPPSLGSGDGETYASFLIDADLRKLEQIDEIQICSGADLASIKAF